MFFFSLCSTDEPSAKKKRKDEEGGSRAQDYLKLWIQSSRTKKCSDNQSYWNSPNWISLYNNHAAARNNGGLEREKKNFSCMCVSFTPFWKKNGLADYCNAGEYRTNKMPGRAKIIRGERKGEWTKLVLLMHELNVALCCPGSLSLSFSLTHTHAPVSNVTLDDTNEKFSPLFCFHSCWKKNLQKKSFPCSANDRHTKATP